MMGYIHFMACLCLDVEAFLNLHDLNMSIRLESSIVPRGKKGIVHQLFIKGDAREFAVLMRDFVVANPFGLGDLQHSKWFKLIHLCRNMDKK